MALGWYGFTAIYPLLLVVFTILGFIGPKGLGPDLVKTLQQFPVIGSNFKVDSGGSNLHGSLLGLLIGLGGLLYGAQGVTQTAQLAMARVWNVPRVHLPGFLPRLGRSLLGLMIIGSAFFLNASCGSLAAGYGLGLGVRVALVAVLLLINTGLYLAAFWTLTPPKVARPRQLLPGAVLGAIGFTLLTTVGTGLVQHQLRHSEATYGAFASIIGVVFYLLLLAKVTVYSAELNPVVARHLWPRAIPGTEPTEADDRVARRVAEREQLRPDERIGVGFTPDGAARGGRRAGVGPTAPRGAGHGYDPTDWSTRPTPGPGARRR